MGMNGNQYLPCGRSIVPTKGTTEHAVLRCAMCGKWTDNAEIPQELNIGF